MLEAGKLQRAIATYQRALQADPGSGIARAKLGIVHLLTPGTERLAGAGSGA